MAAERPIRTKTGKRTAARHMETTPPPSQERQLVDIDPWAILLEQLMETPEEEEKPTERKGPRGK